LAKALKACPGIRLLAGVQMSNHVHLVLRDDACQLSNFMCRFEGPLAKFLNKIDHTSGQVLERRYGAIEAIDRTAIINCAAYVVANPARAGLVARHDEWPGLLVWTGGTTGGVFSRVNRRLSGKDKTESYEWKLATELLSQEEQEQLAFEVERRTTMFEKERNGRPVKGARRVLAQSVFDAPERPKRSPRPMCHASCMDRWKAYAEEWKLFVETYRAASQAFRAGNWTVRFPDFSFRPWCPVRLEAAPAP